MKTPGELNPETASGQPRSTPGVQYRYVRLTEPEKCKGDDIRRQPYPRAAANARRTQYHNAMLLSAPARGPATGPNKVPSLATCR